MRHWIGDEKLFNTNDKKGILIFMLILAKAVIYTM